MYHSHKNEIQHAFIACVSFSIREIKNVMTGLLKLNVKETTKSWKLSNSYMIFVHLYDKIIHERNLVDYLAVKAGSPGSSVGLALAYLCSGSSSVLTRGEIFSTVNGVPLHTVFHYHPNIVLI